VVIEIKDKSLFGLYALQLYESTGISSASQLMVCIRYVMEKNVKEELLSSCELKTTTKAKDAMSKVEHCLTKRS